MALVDCINDTCAKAEQTREVLDSAEQQVAGWLQQSYLDLEQARVVTQRLLELMAQEGQVLECVINGPEGQICTTENGVAHPTIAEALARLNALSIAGITLDHGTATAGQTAWTIVAAPTNPAALEVWVNGAVLGNPLDYTVAGATVTFAVPLTAGDELEARIFTV
jgi:hypothetical protein